MQVTLNFITVAYIMFVVQRVKTNICVQANRFLCAENKNMLPSKLRKI